MNNPTPPTKLVLVNEAGQVLDVFQTDRYDLEHSTGPQTLAQDILAAFERTPSDWTVRPELAGQMIAVLEIALARFDQYVYMLHDGRRMHPEIRQITDALRKLRMLNTYAALPPDRQRQALIDEMTLTARCYEEIGQLTDLAWYAVQRALDRDVNDKEITDLCDWLQVREPELKQAFTRPPMPVEVGTCASS